MADSIQSAGSMRTDYMQLMVTQLQHQNPLEPMSNQEMTAQLAQFTQLEQLESLNQSFEQVLEKTQLDYANSLIGKPITFFDMETKNPDGTIGATRTGIVGGVEIFSDGELLRVAEFAADGEVLAEYFVETENIMSVGYQVVE